MITPDSLDLVPSDQMVARTRRRVLRVLRVSRERRDLRVSRARPARRGSRATRGAVVCALEREASMRKASASRNTLKMVRIVSGCSRVATWATSQVVLQASAACMATASRHAASSGLPVAP